MSSSVTQEDKENGVAHLSEEQLNNAGVRIQCTYELAYMPERVCTEILSYLSLPERMAVVEAVPGWKTHLHRCSSWPMLDLTMLPGELTESNTKFICDVLGEYGDSIHRIRCNICKGSKEILTILSSIADHCQHLKELHLSEFKLYCNTERQLLDKLDCIATKCQRVQWSFNYIYGIPCPLYVSEINHILDSFFQFSGQVVQVMFSLSRKYCHDDCYKDEVIASSLLPFHNLRVLCCPVNALNTAIVTQLAGHSLRELHLISGNNFDELSRIDWHLLANRFQGILRVHQTYYDVTEASIVVNPLRVTLILKNSKSKINESLMNALISRASDALETFVHIHSPLFTTDNSAYTDPSLIPSKYRELALASRNLTTLAISARVPAKALLMFACNRNVRNLWVEESKIDLQDSPSFHVGWNLEEEVCTGTEGEWWTQTALSPQEFRTAMSGYLGRQWTPCTHNEMEKNLRLFSSP